MPDNKTLNATREQNSRWITDAQVGIHQNLEKVVVKHFQKAFQKPIAEHTQLAFDSIKHTVSTSLEEGVPLIFDSCCGTAMSTGIIAKQNPEALVIGIDRSKVRLGKEYNNELPDNLLLVQAECGDFWQLAISEGWKLQKHYILYPNPYPKAKHLKRRWHGHPQFQLLFQLGGEVELRSNWKVYVDEFCQAIGIISEIRNLDASCGEIEHTVSEITPENPLTLFEKKYQDGGQPLYRCVSSL